MCVCVCMHVCSVMSDSFDPLNEEQVSMILDSRIHLSFHEVSLRQNLFSLVLGAVDLKGSSRSPQSGEESRVTRQTV